MLMKILFAIYAAAIPLVPLYGAEEYKRRGAARKKNVCLLLFGVQTLISVGSIISYLGQ